MQWVKLAGGRSQPDYGHGRIAIGKVFLKRKFLGHGDHWTWTSEF